MERKATFCGIIMSVSLNGEDIQANCTDRQTAGYKLSVHNVNANAVNQIEDTRKRAMHTGI